MTFGDIWIEIVEDNGVRRMEGKARRHSLEVMFLIGYIHPLRVGWVALNLVLSSLYNIKLRTLKRKDATVI
jgi:hypothetical protein